MKNVSCVYSAEVAVVNLACKGNRFVVGKRGCTNCRMRGFLHTNQERLHDVPENLRCFFCKDCDICKGSGVESVRKAKIRESLLPNTVQKDYDVELPAIKEFDT